MRSTGYVLLIDLCEDEVVQVPSGSLITLTADRYPGWRQEATSTLDLPDISETG
jgi:hypothetical protein